MPIFMMIFKFILLVIFSIFEVLAVKNGQGFFFIFCFFTFGLTVLLELGGTPH